MYTCSTSLSGGNHVDGLPPGCSTETLAASPGPIWSAPIGTLAPRKLKIEEIYKGKSNQRSREVLDIIVMLLLSWLS